MHKIAVISDMHGKLRKEVIQQAGNCEAILNAGDTGNKEVILTLKKIAPVYVVRGNIDGKWASEIPEELYFNLYGFNFYMVHNRKHIKTGIPKTDIVIYGHSHIYKEEYIGDILYLNPGSCGPGRFRLSVTMAVVTLDEDRHTFSVQKICCIKPDKARETKTLQKDMYSIIKNVTRDMEAGRKITEIAERSGIEEELAEKICRIYSTHQGIDADGILNRLDIWNL